MDNDQPRDSDTLAQLLWNAIFSGTRLRRVGTNDQRVFLLRSILWDSQASRVIDMETGQVSVLPWTKLEFLDPVDVNLPGGSLSPEASRSHCLGCE